MISKLQTYKSEWESEKHYFGAKASDFLVFCNERMLLATMLHNRTPIEDAKDEIKNFKDKVLFPFVDALTAEIQSCHGATNPVLKAVGRKRKFF